jgi:CubicO group peptidase (beta-lactamase class C family)
MKALSLAVLAILTASGPAASPLPRSAPESQGVSSKELVAFVEAADKSIDSLHSFMLVRHGQVVAECWWAPYSAESPHALFSLSKSFTSTAVGLAIAKGKLHLDDELVKLFPEDAPESPSANLKQLRIHDLLRMSTGHQTEPPRKADEPWTKTFLHHPVPFKPGTHFLYNTSGTYMLSAAVQKVTGQTVLDYLKPRLFDPLGIENPMWQASPQGISTGGFGLSIRTEDIAKFGQLYLQHGTWHGRQLVPAAWVDAATKLQTSNGSNPASDWDQGYGYQFWRCRHNGYRGDGAFGQYCVVLPEQDAVIAITSGVRDMPAVLNLVWDKLLPAFHSSPLPADEESTKKLNSTFAHLSIRRPEGHATPAQVAGKKFVFPTNNRKLEWLRLETGDDAVTLVTRIDGTERRIVCGRDGWKKGRASWGQQADQPAAACGAWTADDTFTAKVCFFETPFSVTLQLKFTGDEVRVETVSNVGPNRDRPLTGKAG